MPIATTSERPQRPAHWCRVGARAAAAWLVRRLEPISFAQILYNLIFEMVEVALTRIHQGALPKVLFQEVKVIIIRIAMFEM